MEIFSPQLEIKFLGFLFVPPRHSGQLLNWKWAAVEMKEIFWLLSEARRMPLPSYSSSFSSSFVSVVDLNLRPNLSCLESYCRPPLNEIYYRRRSISKQFPNFSSAALKYSKCASTFQEKFPLMSPLPDQILSCDTLNLISVAKLETLILWSRNSQQFPKFWKNICGQISRVFGPWLFWMPGIPLLKLGPPTCQIPPVIPQLLSSS